MVVPSQSRPQDASASGLSGISTTQQIQQRQRQGITLPGIQELTKVRRSNSSSQYPFPALSLRGEDGLRARPSGSSNSSVQLAPIVVPPSSPTSNGPVHGALSPTSALFLGSTLSNPTSNGTVATNIPSSLRMMLDTAFRASADRFHTELSSLRLLCSRALFNEFQEKEKWKAHCITFKRERDAEREKLRNLTMEYEEKGRGVKRLREDDLPTEAELSGSPRARTSVGSILEHENALNETEFALSYPSPSSHNASPSGSSSGSPPPAPSAVLVSHTRTPSLESLDMTHSPPGTPPALVPAYAALPIDQTHSSQTTFVPFIPGLKRQPSPPGSTQRGGVKKRKGGSSPGSSASTTTTSRPSSPRPRATKKPRPSLEKAKEGNKDMTAFDVILPELAHIPTAQPPTRIPPPGLTPSPPQGTFPLPIPGVNMSPTQVSAVVARSIVERPTKRRRKDGCGSEASSVASTPDFGSPLAFPSGLRSSPSPPPLEVYSGPEYELEEGELVESGSSGAAVDVDSMFMSTLEGDAAVGSPRVRLGGPGVEEMKERDQDLMDQEQEVEIHVVKLPTPPPSESLRHDSPNDRVDDSYDRDSMVETWSTSPPMPSVIPLKFNSRARCQHRLGVMSEVMGEVDLGSTRSSSPQAVATVAAVDNTQTETTSDIDVTHLDLMYAPMNGRLICRVCLSDCKKNQNVVMKSSPKSFPVNAAWETLRDHCVSEHMVECRDVARLRPHEVYNLRRRLMMSMK
ncbi:hypothetical protein BDN72DRAFT_525843 [Pluteus cervinus]|uniref:Uncharacterized protein n=1 Tax=Pluteus cervinus TaxID=181527 RepID=A0ACD3A447_9AGAR|nr:hypothetical protein BDN72DRAFT_525843 [Pluteus cervinus]